MKLFETLVRENKAGAFKQGTPEKQTTTSSALFVYNMRVAHCRGLRSQQGTPFSHVRDLQKSEGVKCVPMEGECIGTWDAAVLI